MKHLELKYSSGIKVIKWISLTVQLTSALKQFAHHSH